MNLIAMVLEIPQPEHASRKYQQEQHNIVAGVPGVPEARVVQCACCFESAATCE